MSDGSSPIVSVIIPCYRQGRFLRAAVESVLGQSALATTPNAVEVIVIDDESPDDTPDVAAALGERIVYRRQANTGVAGARNAGLQLARGRYVLFLDADDYLPPNALESHLAVAERTDADVTVGGARDIDERGLTIEHRPARDWKPDAFHALLPVNFGPPAMAMIRKATALAVGGYDPATSRGAGFEDWDFFLRLALAGARFAPVHAEVLVYRRHPGGATTNPARMLRSGFIVLRRIQRWHRDCDLCKQRLPGVMAIFRRMYAYGHYQRRLARDGWRGLPALWKETFWYLDQDPGLMLYLVSAHVREAGGRLGLRGKRFHSERIAANTQQPV